MNPLTTMVLCGLVLVSAIVCESSAQGATMPNIPSQDNKDLENFDDLFVGDPVEIEKNLRALLPRAQALKDKSIYLQILSQIALAQAMQKNFEEAQKTPVDSITAVTTPASLSLLAIWYSCGVVVPNSSTVELPLPSGMAI